MGPILAEKDFIYHPDQSLQYAFTRRRRLGLWSSFKNFVSSVVEAAEKAWDAVKGIVSDIVHAAISND